MNDFIVERPGKLTYHKNTVMGEIEIMTTANSLQWGKTLNSSELFLLKIHNLNLIKRNGCPGHDQGLLKSDNLMDNDSCHYWENWLNLTEF